MNWYLFHVEQPQGMSFRSSGDLVRYCAGLTDACVHIAV